MANKKVAKVPFSRYRFTQALDYRKSSIRKLGKVAEIERDEKTIRRCLHNGEIPPALLDRIGRYLDVHPDFLSGTYDRPIERIEDETVRMMLKAQIRVEDHPYFTKEQEELKYRDYFKWCIAARLSIWLGWEYQHWSVYLQLPPWHMLTRSGVLSCEMDGGVV